MASNSHAGPSPVSRGALCATLLLAVWAETARGGNYSAPDALRRVHHRLESQLDRYDTDLAELVAFPSVSALPHHLPDLLAAAQWLADRLQAAGLQNVEILPTGGPHPVVYGDWLGAADPAAPTVLVYGHYDVQPVDPEGEWESPPYTVSKRDGYYYGRGVDDDKGGVLMAIQAVEAWLQEVGSLPVNVKFMLEGQEEVMSPHLEQFLESNRERLAASLVMSADGGQPAADVGGISLGLRGIVSAQLEIETAATDMHSGMKGGSVANPNSVVAALVASLHDPVTRAVAVEGFYENVVPVTQQDKEDIAVYEARTFDKDKEAATLGIKAFVGEAGYSVLEQRWHRPTLDVVGMAGGFTGEGIKTVIPRHAMAKLSCRLVPNQSAEDVIAKLTRHMERHCPAYANCTLTTIGGAAAPWSNARDSRGNAAAARVHESLDGGRKPLYLRDGATIPALDTLYQVLRVPSSKFGFGLSERIHAPNERLSVGQYEKGRRGWAMLFAELAKPHEPTATQCSVPNKAACL